MPARTAADPLTDWPAVTKGLTGRQKRRLFDELFPVADCPAEPPADPAPHIRAFAAAAAVGDHPAAARALRTLAALYDPPGGPR